MSTTKVVLAVGWVFSIAPPVGADGTTLAGDGVVSVRSGIAQLFIDDLLIDSQVNLRRTLHQPVKENGGQTPLIAANKGDALLAYGTIVFDSRLKQYVMLVQDFNNRRMLRAISSDALGWSARTHDELTPLRLDLDLGPLPKDAKGKFGIDVFSCFYDVKDEKYPYKGWVWIANAGHEWEGVWYVRSADGLVWERPHQICSGFAQPGDTSCQTIIQEGRMVYGPGDVTLFCHDPVENRFLGIFKFFNPHDVSPGYSSRARAYVWLDRMDEPFDSRRITHVELMPAMAERNGDTPYDEYYASTAWRYESVYLGGLKVFHGKGDYPFSAAGCAFLKLVVSRDGLHWRKAPFANDAGIPEVWLANGVEGGNEALNDGGYISEFSQGPLRIGDELVYYYSASSWGKNQPRDRLVRGGGIFRAKLRVDGFVSVDWGTLTTHPLRIEGERLYVNGTGPMTVQLLDRLGNPLAATVFNGDSLRHEVRFGDHGLRRWAPDGVVRLRFAVEPPGRLYSFTVR
ncbi:MAG: hypothetical protein KA354_09250 [Phycisphaerae bacterium]|nr:hypothetical protein [Phycisphaerae bacterium]